MPGSKALRNVIERKTLISQQNNHVIEEVRRFVDDFIRSIALGLDYSRVAAQTFSDRSQVEFDPLAPSLKMIEPGPDGVPSPTNATE